RQTDRQTDEDELTGYPSIDKPWLKYYSRAAIESELPKCKIYDKLLECNRDYQDAYVLEYFGNKITYGSLFERIEETALAFQNAGIKKGDIVVIACVTIPETIYAIYALNRLGAVPNMVDPRTSVEGIRNYIEEVSSPMVLTIDLAYPKILRAVQNTTVKRIVTMSAFDSMPSLLKSLLKIKTLFGKHPKYDGFPTVKWTKFVRKVNTGNIGDVPYEPDRCCMIVHTGGTTGNPKGVMLTDDNVNAAFHQAINSPILMKRGDVFLNVMPPFIAYGMVLGIHTALCYGWKSVIIPKFNPKEFDKLLMKHKPNGLIGVPSYLENLMNSKKIKGKDLSFIKVLLAGGDKTPPEFEEIVNNFLSEHNAKIHLTKGYSMTEASATATISFENTIKYGSNGVPLHNTVIAAFEQDTDNELPYGKMGEICLNTPTMMKGYYNNESATNDIIRMHRDGKKWIHTGDLGYVDKDGIIYIEGRLKRMIIRYDGFKIFLPFVEKVVMSNSAVESCCAVGKRDKEHGQGELPIVFCVRKKDMGTDLDKLVSELKQACQEQLPEYSQPVGFTFLPELPLTPIGKIDYRALEEKWGNL
ncbi:MAG: acyl--CoA ligase, partial [Lachnospiraceae bacterium]|nr:acyl--CoA ligase [Lachnospiraceae bacterium]